MKRYRDFYERLKYFNYAFSFANLQRSWHYFRLLMWEGDGWMRISCRLRSFSRRILEQIQAKMQPAYKWSVPSFNKVSFDLLSLPKK